MVADQLSGFFSAIAKDGRISITHIGVFAALLEFHSKCNVNPFQAFSYQIMEIAKISAPATYHRCIRQLAEYGYIKYYPSFKRNSASRIMLLENIDNR